jgi:hypothetical protein
MRTCLLVALASLLAGCAVSASPNYDMRFGQAVRAARQAMTINPGGSNVQNPVAGLDGVSAREAQVHYQNSFKEPPPPVNVINITAGGGR